MNGYGAKQITNHWQRIAYLNKHNKAAKEALKHSTINLFVQGGTYSLPKQENVLKDDYAASN